MIQRLIDNQGEYYSTDIIDPTDSKFFRLMSYIGIRRGDKLQSISCSKCEPYNTIDNGYVGRVRGYIYEDDKYKFNINELDNDKIEDDKDYYLFIGMRIIKLVEIEETTSVAVAHADDEDMLYELMRSTEALGLLSDSISGTIWSAPAGDEPIIEYIAIWGITPDVKEIPNNKFENVVSRKYNYTFQRLKRTTGINIKCRDGNLELEHVTGIATIGKDSIKAPKYIEMKIVDSEGDTDIFYYRLYIDLASIDFSSIAEYNTNVNQRWGTGGNEDYSPYCADGITDVTFFDKEDFYPDNESDDAYNPPPKIRLCQLIAKVSIPLVFGGTEKYLLKNYCYKDYSNDVIARYACYALCLGMSFENIDDMNDMIMEADEYESTGQNNELATQKRVFGYYGRTPIWLNSEDPVLAVINQSARDISKALFIPGKIDKTVLSAKDESRGDIYYVIGETGRAEMMYDSEGNRIMTRCREGAPNTVNVSQYGKYIEFNFTDTIPFEEIDEVESDDSHVPPVLYMKAEKNMGIYISNITIISYIVESPYLLGLEDNNSERLIWSLYGEQDNLWYDITPAGEGTTALAEDAASDADSITVSDGEHLPVEGTILIEDEMMSYTGREVSGAHHSLTGITRLSGPARLHKSGIYVVLLSKQLYTDLHWGTLAVDISDEGTTLTITEAAGFTMPGICPYTGDSEDRYGKILVGSEMMTVDWDTWDGEAKTIDIIERGSTYTDEAEHPAGTPVSLQDIRGYSTVPGVDSQKVEYAGAYKNVIKIDKRGLPADKNYSAKLVYYVRVQWKS
jgi:hypothetical protein